MEIKSVKCKSGLTGWQATLHDNYDGSFSAWNSVCEIYHLHERLGYKTPELAWKDNPTIQGSVNPSDFRKVKTKKKA